MIRVSIITPSYNQAEFIEATIQSVLSQTYKNIQYIIVDGGSTDSTMDIVNRYKDKIDIVIHEKDNGQSDAITKGFKLADGELVGWLNSDDILYPNCVEQIVRLAEQFPDGAIYYGSLLNVIDRLGNIIRTPQIVINSRETLIHENYSLIQQGSFYRNSHLKKIGYVDKTIHYCMDLDLWLRLLEHGNIYHYDIKPLGGFRMWEETKTATGGEKFLKDIEATLRRYGAVDGDTTIRQIRRYMLKCRIKRMFHIK